jgi:hypothetical protein
MQFGEVKGVSMRSKTTRRFWKLFWELPIEVRKEAEDAYRIFKRDPYHRSLDFKPVVAADPNIFSVRVGLSYRAMGVRNPKDRIVWYWIGSHAEYDKMWSKGG